MKTLRLLSLVLLTLPALADEPEKQLTPAERLAAAKANSAAAQLAAKNEAAKPAPKAKTTSDGVRIEGAEKGIPTHDWDAAVALSKSSGTPLFVIFTGSDWCGWCQLMEKNVFSKDEWKDFAGKELVVAWVNMPKDKSLLPKGAMERNSQLCAMYGVRGFPTYFLFQAGDITAPVAQFGASRDADAKSFVEHVTAKLPAKK